jgi:hypothetical protein
MKNNKVLTLLLMFFIVLIINNSCFAQTENKNSDRETTRNSFITISAGYPEIYTFGIGYQLLNNLSLKINMNLCRQSDQSGFGFPNYITAKVNYFYQKNFLIINNTSFTYGRCITKGNPAAIYEISVGYESKNKSSFPFYYSVGFYRITAGVNYMYNISCAFGVNINL